VWSSSLKSSTSRQVYAAEAAPVEDIFWQAGVLKQFQITGGIPETFPRLLETLQACAPPAEEKKAA
jgi:hypothetical protein